MLFAAGDDGVDPPPQLPHEAAPDEALEWPSQLPQDAEGVESEAPFPPPQDEASVAGVACQLPQLPEASRFSTTPPRTELANASRTNELFTMVSRVDEGVEVVEYR